MLKFKIVPLCHSKIKHFRAQTKFFSDIFISLNTFSLTLIGESPKSGGETTTQHNKQPRVAYHYSRLSSILNS